MTPEELNIEIQKCVKCEIANENVNVYNLENGYGKLPLHVGKIPVLFVGANPSVKRCTQTLLEGAFCGRETGDLFTHCITKANLNKKDFWITNIVKCSTPENRKLEQTEIDNCKDFLYKEIDLIHPKIIIPLGMQAIKFFDGRVFRIRNWRFRNYSSILFSLPHPAYLKYRPDLIKEYIDQLSKINDMI